MPIPASIVKGTPFEGAGQGRRARRSRRHDGQDGDRRRGDQRQRLLVVGHQGPGARPRRLPAPQRHAGRRRRATIRDASYGMASIPLQFPELAVEMLQAAVKNGARGVTVGGHVAGEPLSAPRFDPFWAKVAEMGELVFMHPNGSANIIQEGGARRPRRPRQHRRQPARDDGVPVAADFRRNLRQVPDAEGLRRAWRRVPAVLPRDAPRWRASGRDRTASSRRSRATTCGRTSSPTRWCSRTKALRHLVAEMGVSQVVFGTDIAVRLAGDRRPGRGPSDVEQRRQGSNPWRHPRQAAPSTCADFVIGVVRLKPEPGQARL